MSEPALRGPGTNRNAAGWRPMPRYFFSTANGHKIADEEGDVLEDESAARNMAIDILAEILPSQRHRLGDGGHYSVVVADEDNQTLFEITATAKRLSA